MTDIVRVPREPTEAMIAAAMPYCYANKPQRALDIYRAMLAASPQEAVPTKREAALADLAKLDGETMDLAVSPQGEGQWITHDGGPNPVPGKLVECRLAASGIPDLPPIQSEYINWGHHIGPANIIAYRVTEGVKP